VENEPPSTSRRVDILRDALESNLVLFQGTHRLEQMLERAPKSVNPPHDQGVPVPHKAYGSF
jgi:hypothetical protein